MPEPVKDERSSWPLWARNGALSGGKFMMAFLRNTGIHRNLNKWLPAIFERLIPAEHRLPAALSKAADLTARAVEKQSYHR